MKLIPIFLLSFLFLNCNNADDTKASGADSGAIITDTNRQDVDSNPVNSSDAITGCYMRVMGRDTLAAHLEQNGNDISGRLTYDNYEKDGSTGTVNGRLENGILKLVYVFQTEGMTSTMETYFKVQNQALVPGTGEMVQRGDTLSFSNPGTLQYDATMLLTKTDCDLFPEKYQKANAPRAN